MKSTRLRVERIALSVAGMALMMLALSGCATKCADLRGTWIPFSDGEIYLPPYFERTKPLKVAPSVLRYSGPSSDHLASCNEIPFHNGIVYIGATSDMVPIQPGMAKLGGGGVLVDIGRGLRYAAVESKDMEAAGFEVAAVVSGDSAFLITGRGAYSHAKEIAATYRRRAEN